MATAIGLSSWVMSQTLQDAPSIIGIQGAQGSGKSTTAALLALTLKLLYSCSTAVLSLDDFYLSREDRQELSIKQHPLFITRGVPGTHDLELLKQVLDRLSKAHPITRTPIPIFEKAIDDRLPESGWRSHLGRPDIILIEGWCIGSLPEPPERLQDPVNILEAEEDPEGIWRQTVNCQLEGPYADLFAQLHRLIMLKVPNFESVLAFRTLQEEKLAKAQGPDQPGVMNSMEIQRFIMHFERLTRWNLISTPRHADLTLSIGTQQEIVGIQQKGSTGV